jgi:hypothetical protein
MGVDTYLEHAKRKLDVELQEEQQIESSDRKKAETIQQVSCLMGRAQAFGYVSQFSSMAELATVKEVKDNKLYREFGIDTWSGFCEKFGINYKTIDERLLNLEKFGLAFMEASKKIGLSRQDLRRIQALPSDTRVDAINQTINMDKPTKEQVRDLLDRIEDQAVDNAMLQKKLTEADKKLAKKDQAITRGQDQVTELEDKIRALQTAQEQSVIRNDEQKSMELMTTIKNDFNIAILKMASIDLDCSSPAIKATIVAIIEYMNRMLKQTFLDICQAHPEIDINDVMDAPGFSNPFDNVAVNPKDDAIIEANGTLRRRASAGGR